MACGCKYRDANELRERDLRGVAAIAAGEGDDCKFGSGKGFAASGQAVQMLAALPYRSFRSICFDGESRRTAEMMFAPVQVGPKPAESGQSLPNINLF